MAALTIIVGSGLAACANKTDDAGVDHFNDPLFGDGGLDPARLAVVSFLCWMITSLAVAAGIGGGGLLVPLYFIGLDIDQTRAVSISKGTIFGVAVGNFFFLIRKRHPNADRPLIDYATAVFMQGGELMGVVLGVLINLLLPQILIIIISAVVLGFNSYKTLLKATAKYQAETVAKAKAAGDPLSITTTDAPPRDVAAESTFASLGAIMAYDEQAVAPTGGSGGGGGGDVNGGGMGAPSPPQSDPYPISQEPEEAAAPYPISEMRVAPSAALSAAPSSAKPPKPDKPPETENRMEEEDTASAERMALAAKIMAEQAQACPCWAWALLLPMCAFFVLYSLLLGQVFDPSFTNCVPGYWAAYVTPFAFYGLTTAFMARRNVRNAARIAHAGLPHVEGDIVWTPRAASMLIPAAIGAGVAAGLLGIGGGMILGPIFVALDFQPQVGTATTGFMILFTAMGGSVKYLTIGKLPWRMFVWFATIGAIGGQTGQRVVSKVIQRTGRPSYVVFILGGIIGVAVIVMTTFGIIAAVEDANCGIDIWAPSTDQFVCGAVDGH